MANKKAGNRAAASQARARERAKRKARSTGPSIPEAVLTPPAPAEDDPLEAPDIGAAEAATADSATLAAASSSRTASPQPERRRPTPATPLAQRRASPQASGLAPAGGLRRELALIGIITAIIGGVLAYLKLATDLGA